MWNITVEGKTQNSVIVQFAEAYIEMLSLNKKEELCINQLR